MTVSDAKTKFVDRDGLDYTIDMLRQEMKEISSKDIDLTDYVTKTELQERLDALDLHVDLSAYSTTSEMMEAIQQAIPDLSEYATKSEIPSLEEYAKKSEIPSLDGYATESYVDDAVGKVSGGGSVDLSNYYTKGEVDDLIPTVTNGEDGFSPVIEESAGNDDATYKLDITTKTGRITTVNLIGPQGPAGQDGQDGEQGPRGENGQNGEQGVKGDPGFSPIIVENSGNNQSTYKLDITDATRTFTTPNLKGADGAGGGSSSGGSSLYTCPSVTDPAAEDEITTSDEIIVGKWIDGRDIYRKTIAAQMPYSSGLTTKVLAKNPCNMHMISYTAVIWRREGSADYPMYIFSGLGMRSIEYWSFGANSAASLSDYMEDDNFGIYHTDDGNALSMMYGSNIGGTGHICYALIDYVKPTSGGGGGSGEVTR